MLSTEHYNLQLPSQKLAPKWLGPLKVLELLGPNTVQVEIPPCFARLTPLQNVENLKPYHPCPQRWEPSHEAGLEDDLWLPQCNLEHAQDILRADQALQTNNLSRPACPNRAQRAPGPSSTWVTCSILWPTHARHQQGTVSEPRGEVCEAALSQLAPGTFVPRLKSNFFRLSPFFKFTSLPQPKPTGMSAPQSKSPEFRPETTFTHPKVYPDRISQLGHQES